MKRTFASPGNSEHHTGMAIDIRFYKNNEWQSYEFHCERYDNEYNLLFKMCAEYGFILRYPPGKQSITGYEYEPWHLRYVGQEVAEYIYEHKQTLEEYVLE